MGVLLSVAVGAAGIGSGCGNPPNVSAAQQCLSIWEDSLPQGVQVAAFEAAGQEATGLLSPPGGKRRGALRGPQGGLPRRHRIDQSEVGFPL